MTEATKKSDRIFVGTYKLINEQCTNIIKHAIDYRRNKIDTAQVYRKKKKERKKAENSWEKEIHTITTRGFHVVGFVF